MKDFSVRNIPRDTIYKDVVIVGNGPSGISLSYMLAGNWPYWDPKKINNHPDEFLRARLNYADHSKSLVEQDLVTLAEGLEGRSTNPISLLLDSLEHPCADLGMELPSMLEYRNHSNREIDHVVVGKGPPGGSWHRMDPNLRTLSLAAWMSLPGLSFSDWETRQLRKELEAGRNFTDDAKARGNLVVKLNTNTVSNSTCHKCMEMRNKQKSREKFNGTDSLENNNESESGALCCKCTKALTIGNNYSRDEKGRNAPTGVVPPRRNLSLKRQVSKEVQTRALVSRVAQYYEDYVHLMNLDKYFVNDVVVTLVAPLQEGCAQGKFRLARWIVMGINKSNGRAVYYACRNIVLANGASDLANRLGLRGESLNSTWVKHDLPQLEAALESISEKERNELKPVLVIGAGLSAADAVTICRSSDIHVIHVFRSRTAGLDKMLPENVYPEYHEVHRMMKDSDNEHKFYTPVPEHTISNLTTDENGLHKVTVQNLATKETKDFDVSFCAILIGSRPDLRYISNLKRGLTKGASLTNSQIMEKMERSTSQNRKLSWLKSLCAKCKQFNLCEWGGSRGEYKKICGHTCNRSCECITRGRIENEGSTCGADESGLGLGIDPTKPVDSKSNQIAMDKYTNEVIRAPKGLYAMGPLVGDNFVRFIPGGALAITAALHREND